MRAASAEATGLTDGTLDLVVFAQSWHWVDPLRAAAEAARILTPGGVLVAVWNQMEVSIPWVHRLTRIMRSCFRSSLDEKLTLNACHHDARTSAMRSTPTR